MRNDKYARVKARLLSGKVFRQCADQRNCAYVQQQKAAGRPLRFIEREDLGELWLEPRDRVVPLQVGAT
jgi:hypothetical protein